MSRVWTAHYDISRDAVRTRVADGLMALGPRVLYSAVDLAVSRSRAHRMLAWAADQVDDGDAVLLVGRCARCRLHHHGTMLETLPTAGQRW